MEGVRIQETAQNFYELMKPLYYFDAMLTGTNAASDSESMVTLDDYLILDKLIENKVKHKQDKSPKYINDTFTALTDLKTQIIINLHDINTNPQFDIIKKLIMDSSSSKDNNLINDIIFRLFPNINRLIIYLQLCFLILTLYLC